MARANFLQPARLSLVDEWVGFRPRGVPRRGARLDIGVFADGQRQGYSVTAEIFPARMDEVTRLAADAWELLFTLGKTRTDSLIEVASAIDALQREAAAGSAGGHRDRRRGRARRWSANDPPGGAASGRGSSPGRSCPTAIILVAVALVTFYAYQRVTEDLVVQRNREVTRLSASQLAGGSGRLRPGARRPRAHAGPRVRAIPRRSARRSGGRQPTGGVRRGRGGARLARGVRRFAARSDRRARAGARLVVAVVLQADPPFGPARPTATSSPTARRRGGDRRRRPHHVGAGASSSVRSPACSAPGRPR